jgi:hypothetical protein
LGKDLVGSVGLNDPFAGRANARRVSELEAVWRVIDRILIEVDFPHLGPSHDDYSCGD